MRIALLQSDPGSGAATTDTINQSLARLRAAAHQAAARDAAFLITPELYLSGYDIGLQATRALAQTIDAPALQQAADIARTNNIAIVLGAAIDAGGKSGLTNTALLFDAAGQSVSRYDKVQLFGQTDRSRFRPGESLSPIIEIDGVRLALAICYDIEFPELARALASRGAQLILVPTANMMPYTSVPTRLVPTRAEENAVFIAYANYCGHEGHFDYTGLSCVVGPDGQDVARAGDTPQLLLAEVDLHRIEQVRAELSYLADRRADLYDNANK